MFAAFLIDSVLVCFMLGDLALEPLFMGLHDHVYEDSDLFFCEQRGKCPLPSLYLLFLSIL
jgi:hypothetical protein